MQRLLPTFMLAMLLQQSGWPLLDCSTQLVQMINTTTPSQISKNRRFVIDQLGYVAMVTDPLARIADYVWQGPNGSLKIRRPTGIEVAPMDPALASFVLINAQDGSLFIPLGVKSPLFDPVAQDGAAYTFRYFIQSPRITADGFLVTDREGNLLWRATEACEAGQIYARYDQSSVPVGFEYSIKGGRVSLPLLRNEATSTRALRAALVARSGMLMERYSSQSPKSFSTLKYSEITPPTPAP